MKKFIFLTAGLILFLGCSSIPRTTSSYIPVKQMVPFDYEIREVEVSIDYVDEEVISQEVGNLLESKLCTNESFSDNSVYLDVRVVQRSFIQNIEQKNSIYLTIIGQNDDDEIVIRENFYIVGDKSFISSVNQFDCLNPIIQKLIIYKKNVDKVSKNKE